MQRQAMSLSPDQLRKLADDLEKEGRKTCEDAGIPYYGTKQKISVDIINKTDESDTWEIDY